MDSTDLTDEQATRLYGQVERQRRYLEAVHARLVQLGFPRPTRYGGRRRRPCAACGH